MNNCLNGYAENEIEQYFGESEESLKKCGKCPNFVYEDGMGTCTKLNGGDNSDS